jgi:hypothetical protein
MRKLISFLFILAFTGVAQAQTAPAYNWAFKLGKDSLEIASMIGKDNAGNIYIAGEFRDVNVDFDPGPGTALLSASTTNFDDVFVAKYNAAGAYQWAFKLGSTNDEWLNDLHVDSLGNVYIVGGLQSASVDLDPGAGVTNATNVAPCPFSAYVAKYNTSGIFQWGFGLGGVTDTSYFQCRAIKSNATGSEVYISGYSTDSLIDYNPGIGVTKIRSRPDGDTYFAKYNGTGTLQWIWAVGGEGGFEGAWELGINPSGNTIYVQGFIQSDSMVFGGGWTIYRNGALGTQDIYTAVYFPNGTFGGVLSVGGTDNEFTGGVSADSLGNIYATGSYFGTIPDMDPLGPTAVSLTSNGNRDGFYSMYRPTGILKSAFTIGGTSVDNIRFSGTEPSGATIVTGDFQGTSTFKPGGLSLTSNGFLDSYLMRYDSNQTLLNSLQLGASSNDYGFCGAVQGKTLYVTGLFNGIVDFDPSAGGTSNLFSSTVSLDIYVGRYNLCGAPITTTLNRTICSGSGFIFKGIARTTNGTYYDTLKVVSTGCDSIVTLNLTVTPLATPTISISASPAATAICPTTSVTFTAVGTNGGASSTFQWKKNSVNVGTNSSTLVINNINNNDTIYCIYTPSDSCVTQKVLTSNKIVYTVSTPNIHSTIITSNPNTTNICTGQSITFTATPTNGGTAPTFMWKKNAVTVGFNSTYTTSSIANNDTIYCIVTSNDSCAGPKTVVSNKLVFTVNTNVVPTATIAANPSNTICSGTNVTFSIASSTNLGTSPTYFWKRNGLVVGTNPTFNSSSLAQGDNITCTIKSNALCAVPDSVTTSSIIMTVTPSVTPSIAISGPTVICTGNNATFNASPVNGGTSPSYQWKVNGLVVGSGPSYSSTSLANGDSITCSLTSNANCTTTNTANSNKITVQVNSLSAPSVSIAASTATICSGSSVTYTPTPVNGGSVPTYQWKVNSVNVATGSTYSASLSPNDTVSCVMTSNSACATTPTATSNKLIVLPAVVPTVTNNSPTTSICVGENLTFTANITNGGTNPSFQWYKNGVMQIGQTASTYSSSTFANNDNIYVELTSNATCANPTKVNSSTKTISIVASVVPSVSVSAPSTTICDGANVTVTASPGNGGTSPTYQWKVNGINSGGVTSSNTFNISTLVNGDKVSCIMTSNSACASTPNALSNDLTFTVNAKLAPSVTIAPSPNVTSVCSGTPMTFIATPSNGGATPTYSWSIDGNAQPSTTSIMGKTLTNTGANPVQTTILVTLNTAPGACVTQTAVLSAPLLITINPNVVPSLVISTPTNTICSGANTSFTAVPSNCGTSPTYQWKVNGNNAGTGGTTFASTTFANNNVVSCVVTPGGGCFSAPTANSNSIVLTVNPTVVPTVSITANPGVTICQGSNVTFTANTSFGGSNPTYQWKLNNNNVGNNTSTYTPTALVNGDQVLVSFTSNATCASPATLNSNALTMTVNPKPAKPTINKLNATTLQCAALGDGYIWKKDGIVLASGNGTRNLTISGNADYQVAVIMNGCTSDISEPFKMGSAIKSFEEIGAKVYPNPVSDKIFVDLPAEILNEENTYRLFAINGESINIQNQISGTKEGVVIELNSIASGVYMLELENAKGKAIYRITVNK